MAQLSLWITEAEVVRLMDMKGAIAALDRALGLEAAGKAENMVKTHVIWGGHHTLHAIGATFADEGFVGTKTWAHANGAAPLVNLIQPGTLYGDRVNELDFKIAKVLRFGGTRTNVGVELFNALNSNAVLTYNQTFSPAVVSGPGAWLQPTQVLTPRFLKFSATFDF